MCSRNHQYWWVQSAIKKLTEISKYREHGVSRRLASAVRSNNEHHPDFDNLLSYLPLTSLHDKSLEMERVDANYQNYQLRMGNSTFICTNASISFLARYLGKQHSRHWALHFRRFGTDRIQRRQLLSRRKCLVRNNHVLDCTSCCSSIHSQQKKISSGTRRSLWKKQPAPRKQHFYFWHWVRRESRESNGQCFQFVDSIRSPQ